MNGPEIVGVVVAIALTVAYAVLALRPRERVTRDLEHSRDDGRPRRRGNDEGGR